MSEFSRMRLWMTITLIIVLIIFAGIVLLAILWVPGAARDQFGEPSAELSETRSIFLSMQLMAKFLTKEDSFPESNRSVTFRVNAGRSASQIANDLQEAGLISDAEFLTLYWAYKGYDRFIREGVYLIDTGDTALEIGNNLVQGESGFTRFAFLPGMRKEEVDNLLVSIELITHPDDIPLATCYGDGLPQAAWLEGFLSPGEYQIPSGSTQQDIYCSFVNRFLAMLPAGFVERINEKGLTLYDAVTLASIVEKEMIDTSEAARIAGVFLNRLAVDMPLQSDPTVQYAVATARGSGPWWESELSEQDLQITSPFNTYVNKELPPAPICNPSLTALSAVADAETHDYYYFRAACDQSGKHVFSETYEQHLAAACQ